MKKQKKNAKKMSANKKRKKKIKVSKLASERVTFNWNK